MSVMDSEIIDLKMLDCQLDIALQDALRRLTPAVRQGRTVISGRMPRRFTPNYRCQGGSLIKCVSR